MIIFDLILNRGWIFREGFIVGEKRFVVSNRYFAQNYKLCPTWNGERLSEFLDCYDPDIDGQFIYEKAKRDGQLIKAYDNVSVAA